MSEATKGRREAEIGAYEVEMEDRGQGLAV